MSPAAAKKGHAGHVTPRHLIAASQYVQALITERQPLLPGLSHMITDVGGRVAVHYAGLTCLEEWWRAPDGVIPAWRQLLDGATENIEEITGGRVTTLTGMLEGYPVTVRLTSVCSTTLDGTDTAALAAPEVVEGGAADVEPALAQ